MNSQRSPRDNEDKKERTHLAGVDVLPFSGWHPVGETPRLKIPAGLDAVNQRDNRLSFFLTLCLMLSAFPAFDFPGKIGLDTP